MPTFRYTAVAPSGEAITGKLKAKNAGAARTNLSAQHLRTTALEEKATWTQLEVTKSRIKPKQLMFLSRQLSAFVQAGIPILDAIRELINDNKNRAVRRVLEEISQDLRAGMTLHDAFAKHPNDFPAFYLGVLGAAEMTGRLDVILLRLAGYLEQEIEAKRKLRSALMYPTIVLVMAVGVVVMLSVFVLPAFTQLFESLGGELPLPTRMLVNISSFTTEWGWLIVLLVALFVIAGFVVTRFRGGRKFKDEIMIRLPVVGPVVRFAMIERFLRILAATVKAGVPIPEAMRVAADSVTNLVFQDALRVVRDKLVMGHGLAEPIAESGLFPGMASQMFNVGEKTGTLDAQLEVAADYYSRELGYKVERLTTLIEPIVTVGLGLIVGFVALAIVSAMYGVYNTPAFSQ